MNSTAVASPSPIASSASTRTDRNGANSFALSWQDASPAPTVSSSDGRLPSPLAFISELSPGIVSQEHLDADDRVHPPLPTAPAAALRSPIQLSSPMAVASPTGSFHGAFTDNPPPYSESQYPRSEGLIGLGLSFAADLPSSPRSPQRALGVSQFLTYQPFNPRGGQVPRRAQAERSCAYAEGQVERPTQDTGRRVRSRLHSAPVEATPAPARPALASPTFAFTFSFPNASMVAGDLQHNQATAQPRWGLTSSTTVTYQPWAGQGGRRHGPTHPGAAAHPLTPEATRWLNSTWQVLARADFSQQQRHTIAQRLGPDARARLMWNIDALSCSGYTADSVMQMLVQPGAKDWLTTLARVLRRLHEHGLTVAQVTAMLQAPNADLLLRDFEPGPSQR